MSSAYSKDNHSSNSSRAAATHTGPAGISRAAQTGTGNQPLQLKTNPPFIVQRSAFHDQQREKWQLLKEKNLPAGKYITTGFEYDIGETTKGNALQGIAHLELMKGNNGFPLPYVLETDAGNTLELVTPPYLLETAVPGQPFPATESVTEAIKEDNQAIASAFTKKMSINKLAPLLGNEFGISWQAHKLNLEPSNLSLVANIPNAVKAVNSHNSLLDKKIPKNPIAKQEGESELKEPEISTEIVPEEPSITLEDTTTLEGSDIFKTGVNPTPEYYQHPQINILTDAAHFEKINDPSQSRLVGRKYPTSYKQIIDKLMETAYEDLVWLQEKGIPDSVHIRIAETVVHQTLDSIREKVVEYQHTLSTGETLHPSRQKVFEPFANLISYIKDYSNAWLKTDLLTYLKGSLTGEQQEILLEAVRAKIGTGEYNASQEYPSLAKEFGIFFSKEPNLLLAISWFDKHGTKYSSAAKQVINEVLKLQLQEVPPFNRPGLFGKDPNRVGIRHDTFLDQEKLNALGTDLGYEQQLHVVEVRAKGIPTVENGQKI